MLLLSKIIVAVVEPEQYGVLKSVADHFYISWLAVGSDPKLTTKFFPCKVENTESQNAGITVALGWEVGVGYGDDPGKCGGPHKLVRSLQARATPNWFSKKGLQSQSYFYRMVRGSFGDTFSYG